MQNALTWLQVNAKPLLFNAAARACSAASHRLSSPTRFSGRVDNLTSTLSKPKR